MSGARRPFGRLWRLGVAVALVAVRAPASEDAAEPSVSAQARPASLAERFGLPHLIRLLESPSESERQRGIQRLAALGSAPALNRLATFAVERQAQLGAREWLTLARSLAPHAGDEAIRLVLAALLNRGSSVEHTAVGEPAGGDGPGEVALLELARGAAALALAEEGSSASIEVLGQALRMEGPSAVAAAMALEAHPPARLDDLLDTPGEPTVELARLLGALGDQRSFHTLRRWVRGESAEVRAASAVALTELGHLETVPLARQWLKHELPVLRDAALRILMLTREPAATRLLVERLSSDDIEADTKRFALELPSPEMASVAISQAVRAGAEDTWWWTLLGRIGGPAVAAPLEAALGDPEHAFAAVHALSRLAGAEGQRVLARALEGRVALPLVARAAAARARYSGERFDGLEQRLQALVRAGASSERAAGAWGLSLLGTRAAIAELESEDEVRVLAAANNALSFDDDVLERAASLLSAAPAGRVRTALAFCLLRPSGQRGVTSASLRSFVAEAGPARPLALRVLAARDEPELRPFLRGYLGHSDPVLRAHVARGLGESRQPSAIGLLVGRFELETDEDVRHAIVCALSARSGRAVTRALELAKRLDPSPRVRSAARLALGGMRLGDPPSGTDLLWAELRSGGEAAGAGALLNVAPGLAFPVFEDPSGVLVVAGVGAQHLGIRLQ